LKALILSGGKGTRLRPITYTGAKQLIPVANKPILFYGIEAIKEAGINDFGIIVGDTKEEIKKAIGDGSKWKIKVTYIEQKAPLGLAHAVKIAEDYLEDTPFIMYLGDNLLKEGVKGFVQKFKDKNPNALILLTPVSNPESFGVAELDELSRVKKLVEKPKNPKSNLALVGVYLFDKNIFKAVKAIKPSWRNELEITDAIQWLLNKGYTVESHKVSGWWKDTGKPEDVLSANRLILESIERNIKGEVIDSTIEGRVIVKEGAKIIKSIIRGPVIIGENTKIINSYIGPFTSINSEVIIERSEIENSIVMKKSVIKNLQRRIDESLIGREVKILASSRKPMVNRFILGERSKVEVLQ